MLVTELIPFLKFVALFNNDWLEDVNPDDDNPVPIAEVAKDDVNKEFEDFNDFDEHPDDKEWEFDVWEVVECVVVVWDNPPDVLEVIYWFLLIKVFPWSGK